MAGVNRDTAERAQEPLPLGRQVPKGRMRWYFASCPKGSEASTCANLLLIVDPDLLSDAFVPRTERIHKYHGRWVTSTRDLFSGYFIVVTADAKGLSQALGKLSFPVWMAGAVGRGFAPIDKDTQEFLSACMDETHTIRQSEAEIVSNELRVLWGPLVGRESQVRRVNRQKSLAVVRTGMTDGDAGFSLLMPLAIPARR